MFPIEYYIERLMKNPGMWVHIRKPKLQRDSKLNTKARQEAFNAIVTVLKSTGVPHECGVRGYLVRTKRTS